METCSKFFAEMLGTFVLVLGGCGAALAALAYRCLFPRKNKGGFYKFISDDFEICFEQIAVQNEGV